MKITSPPAKRFCFQNEDIVWSVANTVQGLIGMS